MVVTKEVTKGVFDPRTYRWDHGILSFVLLMDHGYHYLGKMTLSTGLVKENLTGWQLLDKFILSGKYLLKIQIIQENIFFFLNF